MFSVTMERFRLYLKVMNIISDTLPQLIEYYEGTVPFERQEIVQHLRNIAAERKFNFAQYMKFLRSCLSGLKVRKFLHDSIALA